MFFALQRRARAPRALAHAIHLFHHLACVFAHDTRSLDVLAALSLRLFDASRAFLRRKNEYRNRRANELGAPRSPSPTPCSRRPRTPEASSTPHRRAVPTPPSRARARASRAPF